MNALIIGGRIHEAEDAIALGKRAYAQWSTGSQEGMFLAFAEGMAAVMQGHAHRAQRLLEDASTAPVAAAIPAAAAFAIEAYAMTGDTEHAEAAAIAARSAIGRVPAFEGVLRRSEIWLCVARGQLERAAQTAIAVANWAQAHSQYAAEAFALHDAVRLGHATKVRDRLDELSATTQMRWVPIFARHAHASAARSGDALDEVATAFDEAGASLRAAEAAAEAAVMHHAAGLPAREARSRAHAQMLQSQCDGAYLLRLAVGSGATALTERETEVARLAAQRLTSAEIAARLFLSRRTVEGHLQHAYTKLGVRDRRGLARILDRMP
jgi:DNA-binding CsgD family transcriptional regulator